MTDFELVIFDCDGVLVDSEIIAIQIEVELLAASGYGISASQLTERFSGMSWKEILRILEAESGLELVWQLLEKTESILDLRLPSEVRAIDGVSELLAALPYKKCVCSNTKMDRLDAMLSNVGLKNQFSANIFSAKDLGEGRSKPKPDIFIHGARLMQVHPSRTVVVEDSVHGVRAARAAGMRVIGFTGGSHTYPAHGGNLLQAGAHAIASRMQDLLTTIADIGTD